MGSTFMLKVRTCLKAPQLPYSAHIFCTREFKQYPGGRQMDRGNSYKPGGQSTPRIKDNLQGADDCFRKKSTVRKLPSFPKPTFAAGTAKRRTESLRLRMKSALDEEELAPGPTKTEDNIQPPDQPLSPAEWRDLKESLGNPNKFELRMVIAMFNSGSELDIAKSLLSFVAAETGTLPYKLLLQYLHLCVNGGHDDEVFEVYNIMRRCFPSLETGASSLFIKSFSRTERWKEAINIFQEVKEVFTPTLGNYGDVIIAAYQNGDATMAWAVYDELIKSGKTPLPYTWEALFACPKKTNEGEVVQETEQQERLQGILLYMRNNQIYPQLSLAHKIKTWFESLAGQNWTGAWTTVTATGKCRCCGTELESIQLTAEEFQKVKDNIMVNVIQGRDVFVNTTPEELKSFKKFVETKPPFDVVVDGLNVSKYKKDLRQSETLLAVVSELKSRGKNVLVLGRKHMLWHSSQWNKNDMRLIKQKAHCFFTDNTSEDDPFFLYATLNSGNHCQFVSRDLMRDHKACLPDELTRRLFFKWQRGHQLLAHGKIQEDRVRFQYILKYDTIIQTTGNTWHIPYDDTEERTMHEVPQRWLCLTQKKDFVN